MAADYLAKLEQLRKGKIDELIVTPDDFLDFQTAYRTYQFKTQITGDAHRGGEIHYHRVKK